MLPHTAQFIRRHSIKIKIQAMQKLFSLLFAHVPPSPSPPTATPASPQTLPYTLIFLRWDILRDFPLFVSVGASDAIVARKISAKIPRSSFYYTYFLVSSSLFFLLFLFYYTMARGGRDAIEHSTASCHTARDDCFAFNIPIRVFRLRNSTSVRKCERCQVNV